MRRRAALPVAVLWSIATVFSISIVRADKGRCLRAEVPAPIVLPDDTVHPAGTLTLCVNDYSPVASSHRVFINRRPIRFLFSHRTVAEIDRDSRPHVLFQRTETGALKLLGYVWPSGKKAHAYMLQGEPWNAREQKRIPAEETALPPEGASEAP